ncbi:MAG: OmpA family protein [Crocinitomicaceae bacterium]|nr:OmpA family protein [Crocinitomicaceae bacterium]
MKNASAFLFILFTSLFTMKSQAQDVGYYKCYGGISLSPNNFYSLAFQGKRGLDKKALYGYEKTEEVSKNQIWLFFDTPSSGLMKLNIQKTKASFHIYIFKEKNGMLCDELASGNAKFIFSEQSTKDLNSEFIFVEESLRYGVVLVAKEGIKDSLDFSFDFSPQDEFGNEIVDSLLFDLTTHSNANEYAIHVRDAITKRPVKSKISLTGANEINGAYVASDLILNIRKNIKKCVLKIDAEGYFSFDKKDHSILVKNGLKDTIYLKPLVRGAVAKIDEIYFTAGLATILEESGPKLNRLRDFLLVNASVNIEIQGHVNGDGTQAFSSKRLSKKRAKEIVKYLIAAGISPKRLSAKGFGFTQPVYEFPSSEMEKEANRRVEILIK